MTSVNVTTTKNTVTVNGETRVVTVKTQGPQGTFSDGDKGDVTVSSNGTNIVVNSGAIDNANIASNAAIDLTKLATGALPTGITISSANIPDLTIVNSDVSASAAIAGTKISPDFGSQNITTTGQATTGELKVSRATNPQITFEDSDNNPDYRIRNNTGALEFIKAANAAVRLSIASNGTVDITGNLDVGAGLDVTGNITVTGTVDGRDVATDGTKLDGIEANAINASNTAITNKLPLAGGTITGNLTVGGNFTVNGTTTTIDTTTLTVEDKNIELGKVSTPTDTTADGGGITLRGATDKTFQWLDATDSWTSSEHIALPDNKRLKLGDSQDLQIFHFSGAGYIKNGTGNLHIRPSSGADEGIIVKPDSAVELYFDNSKKLETTSTGAKVTATNNSDGLVVTAGEGGAVTVIDERDAAYKATFSMGGSHPVIQNQNTNTSDNTLIVRKGTTNVAVFDGTGNFKLPADNVKLQLGASQDLELFHSGAHGVLDNITGALFLKTGHATSGITLQNRSGNENMAVFLPNAAVELYYDAVKKFQTTQNGISAIGTQHFFSSGTSGDCTVIIEADTDNNNENDNPRIIFRQDGGLDLSAIHTNDNVLEILNSAGTTGGIKLKTGTAAGAVNGFSNAVDRLVITPDGNIQIPGDNAKLQIGASQDLEIYHDGSNSYISDTGTGALFIQGDVAVILEAPNGENYFKGVKNAETFLYYDNAIKLSTTSTGITVADRTQIDGSSGSTELILKRTNAAGNNGNAFGTIKFNDENNNIIGRISTIRSTAADDGDIRFETRPTGGSLTERLRIKSDGNVQIPNDTGKLQLGASQDLEIYHDGSNSIINDSGQGNIQVQNAGSTILGVTVAGINVTGNIIVSGTVDGVDVAALNTTVSGKLSNIVEDTSPQLGGDLQSNGNDIDFADNDKAIFGTSGDLEIFHNGSNSKIINNHSNTFQIQSSDLRLQSTGGENYVRGVANGAVELYYDGSKKLETTSAGGKVSGDLLVTQSGNTALAITSTTLGAVPTLQLKDGYNRTNFISIEENGDNLVIAVDEGNNGSHSTIRHRIDGVEIFRSTRNQTIPSVTHDFKIGNVQLSLDNQKLQIGASQDFEIFHNGSRNIIGNNAAQIRLITDQLRMATYTGDEMYILGNLNSGVELYYDNSKKFETTSTGIDVTGDITGTGDLTLTSTDTGSSASPIIEFYRNSASPADADYLGQLKFTGENDNGSKKTYAKITGKIDDVSSGTIDGLIEFMTVKAGSNNICARLTSEALKLINGTNLEVDGTDATINGLTVGKGGGNVATNTAFGASALVSGTTGVANVAIGGFVLDVNTSGGSNTGCGYGSLSANTTASNNSGFGKNALMSNTTAANNTAVGFESLKLNTTGFQNVAVGAYAGDAITTGGNCTALGMSALSSNTTANDNTAVGYNALFSNTTAANNTAVGRSALFANITGSDNTGIGRSALANNTASNNTAVGRDSLKQNTTGTQNTAVGARALDTNTTGNYNTALGYIAGEAITTGSSNVAVGAYALDANTTASNNTAVGMFALGENTIGTANVAVGANALDANTTGNNNVGVGNNSLGANTTGAANTGLGIGTLAATTTGNHNTAIGYNSLNDNTTASNNTALGHNSLGANTNGTDNVAVGMNALEANTTASNNTAIGSSALTANTTGLENVAVGTNCLDANTTGSYNTAMGRHALGSNETSSYNVAVGFEALFNNTGVGANVAVGVNALKANTTGQSNVAVGYAALDANTTAHNNTALGQNSLGANTTGGDNTAVGHSALLSNVSGTANVAVGNNVLRTATGSSNTAVGHAAMYNTSTGIQNVAMGRSALASNTTASNNTAVGYNSLTTNTTGTRNVGIGSFVLDANTTGDFNVAVGHEALGANTTADNNTAIGDLALFSNTTGVSNTAVGTAALRSNTTGFTANTAVGVHALYSNTTGSGNVAVGYTALKEGTTRINNTAIGFEALRLGSTGNNCTAVGSTVLTNNTADNNTGLGFLALRENTSGASNVAVGAYALDANTTGNYHVAIGVSALGANTTAIQNTAVGYEALALNTTADYNAAFGYHTLKNNTTGTNNTGLGRAALFNNTTGGYNTAVGYNSLVSNTTGTNNVAVGANALDANTTGSQNVAVGRDSLTVSTGDRNTSLGHDTLKQNTSGSSNVAIGTFAGDNITTGDNNIVIGVFADASSATVDNEITLGDTNIATLRCNVQTISSLSDARDKTNVIDLPEGLDFVTKLRPVKFEWATRDGNGKDGSFEHGFIAQDLQAAQKENDADYLNMVMDENPDRLEASYGKLVPILVKAIQELTMEVNKLKSNG